jgi:MerR family copper efflux transcriptional regulator
MRIGELAALTGVPPKTLRYWEDEGLLPAPPRDASGYRSYAQDACELVGFIRASQATGLSLAEIREVVTYWRRGEVPCRYVRELLEERERSYATRIRELEQARARVRALLARADALEPAECRPERGCHLIPPATDPS